MQTSCQLGPSECLACFEEQKMKERAAINAHERRIMCQRIVDNALQQLGQHWRDEFYQFGYVGIAIAIERQAIELGIDSMLTGTIITEFCKALKGE